MCAPQWKRMLLSSSGDLHNLPNIFIKWSSLSVSLFCRLRNWTWTLELLDLQCPPVEAVGNCSVPGFSLYGGWLGGMSLNYKGKGKIVTNGTDYFGSTRTQFPSWLWEDEQHQWGRAVRDSCGRGWLLHTSQSGRVGRSQCMLGWGGSAGVVNQAAEMSEPASSQHQGSSAPLPSQVRVITIAMDWKSLPSMHDVFNAAPTGN